MGASACRRCVLSILRLCAGSAILFVLGEPSGVGDGAHRGVGGVAAVYPPVFNCLPQRDIRDNVPPARKWQKLACTRPGDVDSADGAPGTAYAADKGGLFGGYGRGGFKSTG